VTGAGKEPAVAGALWARAAGLSPPPAGRPGLAGSVLVGLLDRRAIAAPELPCTPRPGPPLEEVPWLKPAPLPVVLVEVGARVVVGSAGRPGGLVEGLGGRAAVVADVGGTVVFGRGAVLGGAGKGTVVGCPPLEGALVEGGAAGTVVEGTVFGAGGVVGGVTGGATCAGATGGGAVVTGTVVTGTVVTGLVVTGLVVTGLVVTGLVVTGLVVTGAVLTGVVGTGPVGGRVLGGAIAAIVGVVVDVVVAGGRVVDVG
jgi:hypothetical protein